MARPAYGVFVRNLVQAIAKRGVRCTVINPVSFFQTAPYSAPDQTDISHEAVQVIRPKYVSFSVKDICFFNTASLSLISFERKVKQVLSGLSSPPDILYGHFLFQGGIVAARLGAELNIPSVIAVGDSNFQIIRKLGREKGIRDFRSADAFIAVSLLIKEMLMEVLKVPESKIGVFPNGIDPARFFPRDRLLMRRQFGFPENGFIIAFTGHFNERKGPHRLLSAVSGLKNVGILFIGAGDTPLAGKEVLFKGVLENSKLPEMLSAADIFVLPTTTEGSCNAIIEALACGLPVVTSKGRFNDDIVDDNVSMRVDPLNVSEIRQAIETLLQNGDLRMRLSGNALKKAANFDINVRAERICAWMKRIRQ